MILVDEEISMLVPGLHPISGSHLSEPARATLASRKASLVLFCLLFLIYQGRERDRRLRENIDKRTTRRPEEPRTLAEDKWESFEEKAPQLACLLVSGKGFVQGC